MKVALPNTCCGSPEALYLKEETQLGRQLQKFAACGALNLQTISAGSMAQHILPAMLPRGWEGQKSISWDGAADGPRAQALKAAWSILATLPDVTSLHDWPLVPVHPKTLCQLGSPSKVHQPFNYTSSGFVAGHCHHANVLKC